MKRLEVLVKTRIIQLRNDIVDLEETVRLEPTQQHINDLEQTRDLLDFAQEDLEEII